MRINKKTGLIYFAAFILVCAVIVTFAVRKSEKAGIPLALTLPPGKVIYSIHTDKARYNPGQSVTIHVNLTNKTNQNITNGSVELYFRHLNKKVGQPQNKSLNLDVGGKKKLTFHWTPPSKDFQGYSVQAWIKDASGKVLDNLNTAVDVSSTWTKFPRYGYISTYPFQSTETTTNEIRGLKNYYLDGIQFYDWQFKHHVPLAGSVSNPASSWSNINGETNYRKTVLDAIHAAHRYNMVAMNYNLIYGAWADFKKDNSGVNPKWGLWQDANKTKPWVSPLPSSWATSELYVLNPLNTDWQQYIVGRESDVFQAYPFDGWQADQLGDWGTMYDAQGNAVNYEKGFVPLVNYARKILKKQVIFNNVGAFGLSDVAKHSNGAVLYVECWPNNGQVTYNDLKNVIDQGLSDSNGKKSMIIAAYMDSSYAESFSSSQPGYFSEPGVLLTDATIDAPGASHIEIGDHGNMLDAPYFPNHNLLMKDSLKKKIYQYNTFMVAYENLLRGGLHNTSNQVVLKGIQTSKDAAANTVWEFTKSGHGYDVIHLINLLGESSNQWQDASAIYPKPKTQSQLSVKYYYGSGTVKTIAWASPDYHNGRSHHLNFKKGQDSKGKYVQFTVPSLSYWDMIYMRKSK
ncbi:MAG TPA: glycoside hydrolase family 66 protein [Bacillales bacterium]|nr:glycoside hydrolase family 66 protein [Bacillales bacterium]